MATKKVYYTGNSNDYSQLPIGAGKTATFLGGYTVTEDPAVQAGIENFWAGIGNVEGTVEDFDPAKHSHLVRSAGNSQSAQVVAGIMHTNSQGGSRSNDSGTVGSQLADAIMNGTAAEMLTTDSAALGELGMVANEALAPASTTVAAKLAAKK